MSVATAVPAVIPVTGEVKAGAVLAIVNVFESAPVITALRGWYAVKFVVPATKPATEILSPT